MQDQRKTKAVLIDELKKLRRKVNKLEKERKKALETQSSPKPARAKPEEFTILVVDDSSIVRKSIKRDLKKTGYKVEMAETGKSVYRLDCKLWRAGIQSTTILNGLPFLASTD